MYLTKEKYLKNISFKDVWQKIFKKDLQKLGKDKLGKGVIKVTVGDIKPEYYQRATKGGVPQWRFKGNILPDKIKRIKKFK